MPTNIQNVSFGGPQALAAALNPQAAAQLAVEQQQIARQQQLAQALRQQSLTDNQGGGGNVSWTQGLARLAQAYQAGRLNKKVDAGTLDVLGKQAAMTGALFGLKPQGAPSQAPAQDAAPPTDQVSNVPNPVYGSGGVEDDGNQAPTLPAASPSPQQLGSALSPQTAPQQRGGIYPDLPGQSHMASIMQALSSPETYYSAQNTANAPTDYYKNLVAQGLQPGTPAFQQKMAEYNSAQAYKAPGSARGGSWSQDPQSGKWTFMPAAPVNGAVPVTGPNGMGWALPSGTTQAIAATEGAKEGGKAAWDIAPTIGPNGAPVATTRSQVVGAAAGGAPLQTGLAPGQGSFADTSANAGAKYFAGLQTAAQPVNNQVYALKQMVNLASQPGNVYGPGSEAAVKTAGVFNQVGQAFGIPGSFNDKNVTNQQEMSKWAGQVAANAANTMGLNGSDARFQIALESNPSGHLTNRAIQQVGTQVLGLTQAVGGMAQAGARYASAHPGPNAQGEFQSLWNKNYDPKIYTTMAQGPQAVQAYLKSLSPAQRQATIAKSQWLAQYGALPQ